MSWSFVDVSSVTDTSNNITLAEPPGVQQNDLLVAVLCGGSPDAITVPAGWTEIKNVQSINADIRLVMAYIKRGASAPDLTFARTASAAAYGTIAAYRSSLGVVNYGSSSHGEGGNSGTITVTASGFTVGAGALLIACGAIRQNGPNFSAFDNATVATVASGATDTSTAPTSNTWIERSDAGTSQLSDAGVGIADAIAAASGASGDFTVSATSNNKDVIFAVASFSDATMRSSGVIFM